MTHIEGLPGLGAGHGYQALVDGQHLQSFLPLAQVGCTQPQQSGSAMMGFMTEAEMRVSSRPRLEPTASLSYRAANSSSARSYSRRALTGVSRSEVAKSGSVSRRVTTSRTTVSRMDSLRGMQLVSRRCVRAGRG